METTRIKQVILYRRDLKMRKGKIAAQVAHASLKVFFDRIVESSREDHTITMQLTESMDSWVHGRFAKIVLSVEDEETLLRAYEVAQERGIPCALITDSGRTEFHGQPTHTTVALGPAPAADIDEVTGREGLIETKLA